MAYLQGVERSRYVQKMFGRIAARYDLMNRIMTGGQDVRWRKRVIELAALPQNGLLLDLGTGTGDLARLACKRQPKIHAIAADFTLEMMQVGISRLARASPSPVAITWLGADASHLPFGDNYFDAVVSGFLLRNVADLSSVLREQYRVLKPGGRFVALDTSPHPRSFLSPLLQFYLHVVIPTIGRLIVWQSEPYKYLPDSTDTFLEPESLADQLQEVGFESVFYERRMFGTIAIHAADKPKPEKS